MAHSNSRIIETSERRVRRGLFVYLSGPMTAAHGYRVEDNVAAGLRVFFDCVARASRRSARTRSARSPRRGKLGGSGGWRMTAP